jgi:hypothetical protein
MLRHERITEALKTFPGTIWGEPSSRSWDPDKQAECIETLKSTIGHLQKIKQATATLIEHEYPVCLSTTCLGTSISVEQKAEREPQITYVVNEGLLDAIEPYYVLAPGHTHPDDIVILCILEATAEFLESKLREEIEFLEHITEEIPTETE